MLKAGIFPDFQIFKVFHLHGFLLLNDLNVLNRLNDLNGCYSTAPCQEPSSSDPIIVEPEEIATAGFGEVVVALNLAIPPAAGVHIGTGEFVDAAVLGA